MVLGQGLPGIRLRGFNPSEQVGKVERAGTVVVLCRITLFVQPAMLSEMLADGGLEMVFLVQVAHKCPYVFHYAVFLEWRSGRLAFGVTSFE